MPQLIVN